MKDRTREFFDVADTRLATARTIAESDPATALSTAYYAALYAARAALSERDVQARTHRGIWNEFRRLYVIDGPVDTGIAAEMQRLQTAREKADYDAVQIPAEDASNAIVVAARFIEASRRAVT